MPKSTLNTSILTKIAWTWTSTLLSLCKRAETLNARFPKESQLAVTPLTMYHWVIARGLIPMEPLHRDPSPRTDLGSEEFFSLGQRRRKAKKEESYSLLQGRGFSLANKFWEREPQSWRLSFWTRVFPSRRHKGTTETEHPLMKIHSKISAQFLQCSSTETNRIQKSFFLKLNIFSTICVETCCKYQSRSPPVTS